MEKAFVAVQNNHEPPKMDGYVFGKGSVGVGYYSLCTREAYQFLCETLRQKETVARQLDQEQDNRLFGCCFRKATVGERLRRERLQDFSTMHRAPIRISVRVTTCLQKVRIPFPLNCVLEIENTKSKGCTILGDVCDVAGCGG